MAVSLNYDSNNKNGVVWNEKYPNGAMFIGEEYKPNLGFEYKQFMYYSFQDRYDIMDVDSEYFRPMTEDEKSVIKKIAEEWIQPLGQEGNPTEEQKIQSEISKLQMFLSSTDWVEPYLIKHYTGIELLNENSSKFDIEIERKEAVAKIKELEARL
jgi:hypothetical protein